MIIVQIKTEKDQYVGRATLGTRQLVASGNYIWQVKEDITKQVNKLSIQDRYKYRIQFQQN